MKTVKLQEDELIPTTHYQPGPKVYIFTYDLIMDMRDPLHLSRIRQLIGHEVSGTGMGEGIETIWWDTTNRVGTYQDTPEKLMELGRKVRGYKRSNVTLKERRSKKSPRIEITDLKDMDWLRTQRSKDEAVIIKRIGDSYKDETHSKT